MDNYNFDFSDSDTHDLLFWDIQAISAACLPSTSKPSRNPKENSAGPDTTSAAANYSADAVMDFSDDEEDDFEAVHAIQRRFSQYCGETRRNEKRSATNIKQVFEVGTSLEYELLDVGFVDRVDTSGDACGATQNSESSMDIFLGTMKVIRLSLINSGVIAALNINFGTLVCPSLP
ncbi:hypothetical protein Ancab_036152 [Ancistrocladus abbreviatus]